MKDKVTLYIATHNVTGKKYFGKTVTCFTKEELQKKYHGSGEYWSKHKKKHGDDITMEIYQICSLNESDDDYVEPIALQFSEENDIVRSKEWANLEFENGLTGAAPGRVYSEESITKMSKSQMGKTASEETKQKMSKAQTGRNLSVETKSKISETKKGSKHTEETKSKMKESKKNMSNETKEKMSKAKQNMSNETKNKISKSNKDKPKSETHKAALREAAKDRPKIKCPHCSKEGYVSIMTRWHFDNCKSLKMS